jgi:adenylate cyclase
VNSSAPPSIPRNYPDGVIVIKRSARGAACAPAGASYADIEHWLLYDAAREHELLLTYEAFLWRMVAAGLPLDRASLHIGTLHPQLLGFAWNWRRSDGLCDEVKVRHFTADTDAFKLNPLSRIFESGGPLRRQPQRPEAQAEFPIMRELAAGGYTEYLALPLGDDRFRHAVTFATMDARGFADEDIEQIQRLLRLFTLHVERHIAVRIATNTLNAYLGPVAAAKVLSGEINRGSGQSIHAMIWVSDLRGFTDLSGRLSGGDMIALLNAYFESFAGAVLANGGEVLKFMGDGLLAVFPLGEGNQARVAASAALAAAEQAHERLNRINQSAPAPLDGIDGWRPLRAGIALHEGEVFFGNIGAPERLDFTVIGPAVNEASRVESLQKTIGRSILITGAAARLIDAPLDFVGAYELRGVAEPVAIYSPTYDVTN